jgi:alkanesulfonate monooxygenase
MTGAKFDASIDVFATTPQFSDGDPATYVDRVVGAARWSEDVGCKGILVYSDNSQVDPWLVAQEVVRNTSTICPLVAVQPVYMHPFTVAKLVASIGAVYGRRVYLNMVAGGFANDLQALNDPTPHDRRYDRLVEYTTVVMELLHGPLTFTGEFYQTSNLKLSPPLPVDLFPGVFVSGSSDAGLAAAKKLGATAVKYPRPPDQETVCVTDSSNGLDHGLRVGIIARETTKEAWEIASSRFPSDRRGQLLHQLAMKVSDSAWHQELSKLGARSDGHPYWLAPFENYQSMCPYLVGSYERVGEELGHYLSLGYQRFILDIPPNRRELEHMAAAFERACSRVTL